jgi:hypothetical protein
MGLTADCTIEVNGEMIKGKALLETAELLFRGPRRIRVPFSAITNLQTVDEKLVVSCPDGPVIFHLGPAALKWEKKIRNPPTLLDKLGCKAELRLNINGAFEVPFLEQLQTVGMKMARKDVDILLFRPESASALSKIEAFVRRIKPEGAIWVVYPKGVKSITEAQVMAAAKNEGMVDVKVAGFSPTLTAIKFVIPKTSRPLPTKA